MGNAEPQTLDDGALPVQILRPQNALCMHALHTLDRFGIALHFTLTFLRCVLG